MTRPLAIARDVIAAPVRRMRGTLGLGNVAQPPDPRDYDIRDLGLSLAGAPDAFDLDGFGRVVFQGGKNCCVGEAIAGAAFIREQALGIADARPLSADFVWSLGKAQIGRSRENSGVAIRDAFRGIARVGICEERHMPRGAAFTSKPSGSAYGHAVGRRMIDPVSGKRVGGYYAIRTVDTAAIFDTICAAIWTRRPVVCGSNFIPAQLTEDRGAGSTDNPIRWAELAKLPSLGGHAFLLDGFDRKRGLVWMRNSWGTGWRFGGRAALTADSLAHLRDFWAFDGWPRLAAAQKDLVLNAQ